MWEAANAPTRESDTAADGSFGNDASQGLLQEDSTRQQHPKYHRQQHQGRITRRVVSSETIEAALSRLSKAYTTSIECIGAINNTNRMVLQQEKKASENNMSKSPGIESALQTIQKVSNVARTTLERAILLDPLVLPHLPTLHQSMTELSNKKLNSDDDDGDSFRWKAVQERRPMPPTVSSAAHKSTLVKLAYLSLVNYSDLLLQSSSTPRVKGSTTTILDRGIVPKVSTTGCWGPEDAQEMHRLAVAALCDAANLDGTDPITWLKLACASRSLERTIASTSGNLWTTVERSQHRRLQRKALERGSLALPTHVPPNRTIVKALREFHSEPDPKEYVSKPFTAPLVSKKIELTRYSWSVLGKMILRACKGEELSTMPWDVSSYQNRSDNNSAAALFGSPTVAIQLSPMLVLPSRVLGKICQYLENTSIWKFEATCRALSVNIISARASLEHHESDHEEDDDDDDAAELLLRRQEQRQKDQLVKMQNQSSQSEPEPSESDHPRGDGNATEGTSTAEPKTNKDTSTNNSSGSNSQSNTNSARQPTVPPRQKSRTSKRVRSKQLSTGKKQDREAKRNSFNYCFLAATLSCTIEKHNSMAEELLKGNQFDYLFRGKEDKSHGTDGGRRKGRDQISSYVVSGEETMEATERVSEASLSSFVKKWSSKNSGPMELLERYLAHVAMFAEKVFASDSPTMGLHSCILSLFQSLLLRSGSQKSIIPRFFRSIAETGSFFRTLELFAMDLIHAELIFRQCDRHSPTIVEFDDDANLIALMIPSLVEACNEIKQMLGENIDRELCTRFCVLEVRCYWLTASFYLWRSRIARAIYLSREAEDEGINFIGMTIDCFDSLYLRSIKSVKTPHLVSPGRQDPYWREISPISLVKFRDEIQASSVVSHARQQFQELVSNLKKVQNAEETPTEISTDDARVLSEIGRKLFERYNTQYGSANSKLSELVDNFLEMRGRDFLAGNTWEVSSKLNDEVLIQREPYKVEDLQRVSNPTILSMLVICLNIDEKKRLCIAELLVRLVLSTIDMHGSLINKIADYRASQKQTDGYHSDDAMSDSDDEMSDGGPRSSGKDDDEKKARQCGHFAKFLINCLCELVPTQLNADERSELFVSSEFGTMIQSVLEFSNRWFQSTVNYLPIPNDGVDKGLVQLMQKMLTGSVKAKDNRIVHEKNESVLFRGLVKILVSQQDLLKSLVTSQVDRSRRTARQRTCINRAQFIALVASKLGSVLSLNLSSVDDFVMRRGRLFEGHIARKDNEQTSNVLTYQEEIIFLRSIRWLRKYAFQDDGEASKNSQANATNSFDRPITKELKIPIATLAIGVCGSSSCSRQYSNSDGSARNDSQENSKLSLMEFYDSDASMNDWLSDDEDENRSEKSKKELVRVICHSIHCIALLFDMIDEKDTLNRFLDVDCDNEFGPLLPLVSARVLNFFADTLLVKFGDDDGTSRQNLWLEEYPFHTKYIGALLDITLHKCYRWLYGFALIGEQNHQSTAGSELAHAVNPITEIAEKSFRLENTAAAGQLYRCIVRAYPSGGRRTPPKQALEAVSAALPPVRESEQSKALRRFALAGDNTDLDLDSLLKVQENWDSAFHVVRDSIMQNKDDLENSGQMSLDELEAMQVRRGLSKQLAIGPLPIVSSDQKHKSDTATDDDRAQTTLHEKAITKKFNAIFDDLCLMDANNWEGWYRASQCCVLKADAIADRLGLTLGFARSKNFSIPADRGLVSRAMNLSDLQEEQEQEEKSSKQISFLGDDYSIYMNSQWSSLSSLQDCVATIKKQLLENTETDHSTNKNIPLLIWEEIESKYDKGDFVEFQEICGGIFVKALRNLAVRSMSIALYILQSRKEMSSDLKVLLSDVCETLGNNFYSGVMASQSYGWPMLAMTTKRKRTLAITAKSCYQASIKHADDSVEEDEDVDNHSTWDLQFMVGKCLEKIAGTYDEEKFSRPMEMTPRITRIYEQYMSEAMSVYANALAEAIKLEDAGTQLPDQAGGSNHGSTEILYRLHASRLKCLIRAVSRNEEEREEAQLEALRLTENYRFKPLGDNTMVKDPKERRWAVFADVVDGLAECRKLKPFFHRSVFRHAQALMWSPLFFDPVSSKTSMHTVSATHASQIAGLDSTKPAAFSALEVISTLFDKKRSQLCAVWVTNGGAASPFQAMNGTIRKYDSLRGKYIDAYLEALHLCYRRSETETFLKWLYGSKRDHPSHFRAGAMNNGEQPITSHVQDPLLITESNGSSLMSRGFLLSSKRRANSVLADILIHEVSNLASDAASKQSSDGLKVSETYLKNAYAYYLRLNCSIEDLKRLRAFKYGTNSIREVDAMCQAYLSGGADGQESLSGNDFGDWTGGGRKLVIFKNALSNCKKLFPTLSAHNFFGKSRVKKGKNSQTSVPDPDDNQQSSKKRKAPSTNEPLSDKSDLEENTKKVSFEVAVPTGLKSGDTFLTSVKVADSQPIKVKLTVPEGNHSTLRFNLKVPKSPKQTNKKAKASS